MVITIILLNNIIIKLKKKISQNFEIRQIEIYWKQQLGDGN